MVKKILLLIFSIFSFTVIFSTPVLAHVLKNDGAIGAILHVTPDDDPIAGEKTDFFFDIKDKQGKFTRQSCDCNVSIFKGEEQLFSQALFASNPDPNSKIAVISFTFPEKNIYKIRVSGSPNTPDAFQPFNLEYDLRVARGMESTVSAVTRESSKSTDFRPVYYTIGGLLAFFVAVFLIRKFKTGHLLIFIPLILFTLVHATPAVSSFIHNEHHHLTYSPDHPCCLPQSADKIDSAAVSIIHKVLPKEPERNTLVLRPILVTRLQNKSPPLSFS
jgi:hypothetical protein